MKHCTIKLSGSLARRFGRVHHRVLETGTLHEALSALKNTIPAFEACIKQQMKQGMEYALFRNRENIDEQAFDLKGTRELRIVPVIQGSKRGGVIQTVVGTALIIAAFTFFGVETTIGQVILAAGVSTTAGGVIQMLSPQPRGLKQRESEENKPSYAFGGPVNTTAAGHPVPIVYGQRRIGGAFISAGIYAEDIA